ncbi:MAG: SdiA-regulated domain-containing protein [Pseudomonadota bacterium]
MSLSLTFLTKISIENRKERLTEPSGLAQCHDKNGFWTVSDDTEKVFQISMGGKVRSKRSIPLPDKGLEGITIDPAGTFLFAVREESNEIIKLDIAQLSVVSRHTLSDMTGYDAVAPHFANGNENKGLEGVAWNSDADTIVVLKEGEPGLLIEIDADLTGILGHAALDDFDGFTRFAKAGERVDYSDICYDSSRGLYWVVSDKAKRVYHFDFQARRVVWSAPLSYAKKGEYREIEKAEGVVYDPVAGRLYVASDEEATLYTYDVRP